MLQFIVLGYVPGTSIQLNFYDFLIGVLLTVTVMSFVYVVWATNIRTMHLYVRKALFYSLFVQA